MDSTSLKQIPKFSGERKHFAVWLTKGTAVCALKGVSPELKPGCMDMLPANDAIPLDRKKPDELQFIMFKNASVVEMNLLTVMLCDTDATIMIIDSTKTEDWPNGLVWKLIEKLFAKFKPSDTFASAEQLEKLMKLTLKKKQDVEYLKSKIASLNTNYGCQIGKDLKIVAIVKAGGSHYSDTICSKTKAIKRAGGNATSANLIQAMVECFRIYGKEDSDMSDSDYELIRTRTSFNFDCNLCGKGRYKARGCPQHDKIKCEHCGWLGHKKETCWKLEANKSKRPEWWIDTADVSVNDSKIIL
jgi:hypothetical protein